MLEKTLGKGPVTRFGLKVLILLIGVVTCLCLISKSFTSDSEFWSISEAHGLFLKYGFFDLQGTFHRPLLLFLLKLPSLFELSNSQHVQLSKSIFGINGILILFWSWQILKRHFEPRVAAVLLAILLANEIFFFQFYRIRGDLLAAQICLFLWWYIESPQTQWNPKTFFIILLGSTLAVGASLKATCFLLLISTLILKNRNQEKPIEKLSFSLAPFVAPSVAVILATCFFRDQVESLISYAIALWKGNPLGDGVSWRYYLISFFRDWVGMALCLSSLIVSLYERRWKALMFFFFSASILIFQPHKTPFFWAALWPFLIIFSFVELKKYLSLKVSSFIFLGIFSWSLMTFSQGQWYFSGEEQLNRIADLDALISDLKVESYMDGIALLPRFEPYRFQVDPFDTESQARGSEILQNRAPDLVLLTPRIMFLDPGLSFTLDCCYKTIGNGIYLRKDFPRFPTFSKGRSHLEMFGFEPIP